MNVEIANKLVELRKKFGYSQEQLAEKIGVSRQAVSKWERSESSPDTDNLIALAKIYNLSIDEMLNYSSSKKNGASDNISGVSENVTEGQRSYGSSSANTNKYLRRIPIPVVAAMVYLVLGFFYNLWHPGWLVFMIIPIWYAIFPDAHDE